MRLKTFTFLFLSFLLFSCEKKAELSATEESAHGEKDHAYYTCTMHPQVHEHSPGNCPICGMPLVKVSGAKAATPTQADLLLPTDYQAKVLQLSKGKVERKTVSFEIPAGGRHLGSDQVAFYVYEKDLMRVKVGQRFEGECSSMPGETLVGVLTQIDSVADPSSRSVRVVGRITSAHKMNLLEGSFFGKILTTPVSALMVPYDAVLRTGEENIVYQITEEEALVPKKVGVGLTLGDEVEITRGLSEGELISFGPDFLIDSETRLRGSNREGAE